MDIKTAKVFFLPSRTMSEKRRQILKRRFLAHEGTTVEIATEASHCIYDCVSTERTAVAGRQKITFQPDCEFVFASDFIKMLNKLEGFPVDQPDRWMSPNVADPPDNAIRGYWSVKGCWKEVPVLDGPPRIAPRTPDEPPTLMDQTDNEEATAVAGELTEATAVAGELKEDTAVATIGVTIGGNHCPLAMLLVRLPKTGTQNQRGNETPGLLDP